MTRKNFLIPLSKIIPTGGGSKRCLLMPNGVLLLVLSEFKPLVNSDQLSEILADGTVTAMTDAPASKFLQRLWERYREFCDHYFVLLNFRISYFFVFNPKNSEIFLLLTTQG